MATLRNTTNLSNYLLPSPATRVPNVLDENGTIVPYNSPDRMTNENTVVDLGDSPNSNTGDPLRVAFVKINNFIEASYQVNKAIDSEIQILLDSVDGGIYI